MVALLIRVFEDRVVEGDKVVESAIVGEKVVEDDIGTGDKDVVAKNSDGSTQPD